jgi:mono/diheme cytochrome c family protein
MKVAAYALAVVSLTATVIAGDDGAWLTKVPGKNRARSNPFAGNPEAVRVGAKLFDDHCAQCHGTTAEGKKGPSLRSTRIEQATAGELEWLLTNGNMKRGMPSWSRLPEQQRWQLVSYLKSLQSP